jgi:pimeloyl-ACP methyl ester carboxylesterase
VAEELRNNMAGCLPDSDDRRSLGAPPRRSRDWLAAARVDQVVVVGLSMGGSLTLWSGFELPGVTGLVCINPATTPQAPEVLEMIQEMVDDGTDIAPAIAVTAEALAALAGRYHAPFNEDVVVLEVRNGQLVDSLSGTVMIPWGGDRFRPRGTQSMLQFTRTGSTVTIRGIFAANAAISSLSWGFTKRQLTTAARMPRFASR